MSAKRTTVQDIADELLRTANLMGSLKKMPENFTVDEMAADMRKLAGRLKDAAYFEKLEAHRAFLEEESHDEGDLAQWYIHSVWPEDKPVWTEAHLKELVQDYWLIAKPMDERFKRRKRTKKKGSKR